MSSRLEKKVDTCFGNKEYYEAHQVYRTLYSRWLAAGKHKELLDLLFDGSNKLFSVDEIQSGIDLVDLFANVLVESKIEPTDEIYSRLEQLLEQLIIFGGAEDYEKKSTVDARNKFVNDVITWSQARATKRREKKRGLSDVHYHLAKMFWKNGVWEQARNHLLVAEQPEEFARFLVEMHQTIGHPNEDDLFITLAVLQLAQFTALIEQYNAHLTRDSSYTAYLMKIGELFFGKRAPPQNGGLLGSLFKGLLGPEKRDEPELFSDSDFDDNAMESENQADDEDGFETADEDEPAPSSSAANAHNKKPVVDTMDDLD